MRHLDLFSGIGGFALATEMVWKDVEHTFCDNDDFCRAILEKHWPQSTIYGDIRSLTADAENKKRQLAVERKSHKKDSVPATANQRVDLLTGGFPCQPFSQAGRRRGTEDDRYLWPEMLRVIREFQPRWIIGENVGGLLTWDDGVVLKTIQSDLGDAGYEVQSFVIPAAGVDAPHRRDRVWIVGRYTKRINRRSSEGGKMERSIFHKGKRQEISDKTHRSSINVTNSQRKRHSGQEYKERSSARHSGGSQSPDWSADWTQIATRLCRVDDGIPRRLDRNPRLKALGNAIVPQVAAEIMRAIKHVDENN